MERKHRWYEVLHGKHEYMVQGDWEEYVPATEDEPHEGGCFYEYDILLNDERIIEHLNVKTIKIIVEVAEQCLREM